MYNFLLFFFQSFNLVSHYGSQNKPFIAAFQITVITDSHSNNLADPRALPIWGNSIHI